MTLKKFFLKESLKINFIIFILISIMAFYSINMEQIKNYKKEYKNRLENFSRIFDLELENNKKLVHYLSEDRELDYYVQYGVYFYDREVKKENDIIVLELKKEKKPIKKYLIMSKLKNIYGIKNRDMSVEIYNEKKELVLGKNNILEKDMIIEQSNFENTFEQIVNYYIVDNEVYMRIYALSRSKHYIVVLNYKFGSDFLDRFEQMGLKLIIADKGKMIASSSFIDGKRVKELNLDFEKDEFIRMINKKRYSIVKKDLEGFNGLCEAKIFILEKTDLFFILTKVNILLLIVLLIIGTYVYLVFKNIYRTFIELIVSIKRNLEGESIKGLNSNIKEQNEILKIIERYKTEKDHIEKIVLNEIETKTKELKNLNYDIKLQNSLLKDLAGKEDSMDILGIVYEKLSEIIVIEELKFVTLIKDGEIIKIVKVNSKGSIQELSQKREDGMKFYIESENGEMHILDAEKGVKKVISVNFETKNIEWGVLSIVFELKNNFKDKMELIRELMALITLVLKSAKLYEMSIKDSLTGVLNRSVMNFYIEKIMKSSLRYKKTFSLIMLDIDYFKIINDKYGHIIGDFVLKKIVKILEISLREVDSVFRYGGEEFVILLPEEDREKSILVAERIRQNIMDASLNLEDFGSGEIKITVSMGVAEYNSEKHKVLMDIVEEADEKMYMAKENGRNRVY